MADLYCNQCRTIGTPAPFEGLDRRCGNCGSSDTRPALPADRFRGNDARPARLACALPGLGSFVAVVLSSAIAGAAIVAIILSHSKGGRSK